MRHPAVALPPTSALNSPQKKHARSDGRRQHSAALSACSTDTWIRSRSEDSCAIYSWRARRSFSPPSRLVARGMLLGHPQPNWTDAGRRIDLHRLCPSHGNGVTPGERCLQKEPLLLVAISGGFEQTSQSSGGISPRKSRTQRDCPSLGSVHVRGSATRLGKHSGNDSVSSFRFRCTIRDHSFAHRLVIPVSLYSAFFDFFDFSFPAARRRVNQPAKGIYVYYRSRFQVVSSNPPPRSLSVLAFQEVAQRRRVRFPQDRAELSVAAKTFRKVVTILSP